MDIEQHIADSGWVAKTQNGLIPPNIDPRVVVDVVYKNQSSERREADRIPWGDVVRYCIVQGADGGWIYDKTPVSNRADVEVETFDGHRATMRADGAPWELVKRYRVVERRMVVDANGWTTWHGGVRPVPAATSVEVKYEDGAIGQGRAELYRWGHSDIDTSIVAYRLVSDDTPTTVKCPPEPCVTTPIERAMFTVHGGPESLRSTYQTLPTLHEMSTAQVPHLTARDLAALACCSPTAPDLLAQAKQHMEDRAATYDKPEGERSMGKTVQAFNAITGRDLPEADGWLFMILLKLVRSEQRPEAHRDSVEDLVAYASLFGEARLNTTP